MISTLDTLRRELQGEQEVQRGAAVTPATAAGRGAAGEADQGAKRRRTMDDAGRPQEDRGREGQRRDSH
jgi:hypothetical protein